MPSFEALTLDSSQKSLVLNFFDCIVIRLLSQTELIEERYSLWSVYVMCGEGGRSWKS
jgi:hypothetical protein